MSMSDMHSVSYLCKIFVSKTKNKVRVIITNRRWRLRLSVLCQSFLRYVDVAYSCSLRMTDVGKEQWTCPALICKYSSSKLRCYFQHIIVTSSNTGRRSRCHSLCALKMPIWSLSTTRTKNFHHKNPSLFRSIANTCVSLSIELS